MSAGRRTNVWMLAALGVSTLVGCDVGADLQDQIDKYKDQIPQDPMMAAPSEQTGPQANTSAPTSNFKQDPAGHPAQVAGVQQASMDIGADGGAIATSSAALDVPSGAVAADVKITVAQVDDSAIKAPIPSVLEPVAPAVSFTPHGTTFEKPVTLSLFHNSTSTNLVVLRLANESDTTWERVEATFAAGVAYVETTHFSLYGVSKCDPKNDPHGYCSALLQGTKDVMDLPMEEFESFDSPDTTSDAGVPDAGQNDADAGSDAGTGDAATGGGSFEPVDPCADTAEECEKLDLTCQATGDCTGVDACIERLKTCFAETTPSDPCADIQGKCHQLASDCSENPESSSCLDVKGCYAAVDSCYASANQSNDPCLPVKERCDSLALQCAVEPAMDGCGLLDDCYGAVDACYLNGQEPSSDPCIAVADTCKQWAAGCEVDPTFEGCAYLSDCVAAADACYAKEQPSADACSSLYTRCDQMAALCKGGDDSACAVVDACYGEAKSCSGGNEIPAPASPCDDVQLKCSLLASYCEADPKLPECSHLADCQTAVATCLSDNHCKDVQVCQWVAGCEGYDSTPVCTEKQVCDPEQCTVDWVCEQSCSEIACEGEECFSYVGKQIDRDMDGSPDAVYVCAQLPCKQVETCEPGKCWSEQSCEAPPLPADCVKVEYQECVTQTECSGSTEVSAGDVDCSMLAECQASATKCASAPEEPYCVTCTNVIQTCATK